MSVSGRLFPVGAALVALSLAFGGRAAAQQPPAQAVLIDQLLNQVQMGLAKAQKDLSDEAMPTLQSVTLDLKVEAARDAGAKLNLYIISFGRKVEKDGSQEIELTLKPPSSNMALSIGAGPSVADELVSAIVAAARGVHNARKNKNVPLVTSSLKVVLSFVVKQETSGGVKFTIAPVTADLSGTLTDTSVQKMTVTFENPK